MKKMLSLLILCNVLLLSQDYLVTKNHPVILFIQRINTERGILGTDFFQFPVHRSIILKSLEGFSSDESNLSLMDRNILNEFKLEFGFPNEANSQAIVEYPNYKFPSERESYFYFASNDSFSIGVNLKAELGYHARAGNSSAKTVLLGGNLAGSLLDYFSFNLQGMNGLFFGNKGAVLLDRRYSSNYKLMDTPESAFFDETEGNFSITLPYLTFTLARADVALGHGKLTPLVNRLYPKSDYISLQLNYGILNYSFFHGTLLGPISFLADSVTQGIRSISEKFLVYHKVAFDVSDDIRLNFGEMAVYSDRGIDLAYLNPFNFYKTVEHSRVDRDNTLIFAGFEAVPAKGFRVFSTLLFDDIDFSKAGSGWWGNQVMIHTGLSSFQSIGNFPLDINAEFLQIQPYVFSHRIERNNFSNLGTPLWGDLDPNSMNFSGSCGVQLNPMLYSSIGFSYTLHGKNEYDVDGNLITNFGGNSQEGHRAWDSETVFLLDGIREYKREFNFFIRYEPVNNYFLQFKYRGITKSTNSLKSSDNSLELYLTLKI